VEARYAGALEPLEAMVAAWDFRGAESGLAKLRFDEPQLAARLACRIDEVRRMAPLKERMIAHINAAEPRLQKRDLMIRGINGDLVKADRQGITTESRGGKTELHVWGELGEETVRRLVRHVVDPENTEDWLAAGLLALARNDAVLAEKCAEEARSRGAQIDHYLEALAAAAIARVAKLLEEEKFSEADAALANIEEKYGTTALFASNSEALESAREKVRQGIARAEAEKLYKEAAKLFKQKQFFDLKPLVERLKADYPQTAPVTDTRREPSFAQMEEAVGNLGQRLIVRQDGKGDFTSIQEAINAAQPNSLIEIQDNGPYNEKLEIPAQKEGLTLGGKKGCWPIITSAGPRSGFQNLVMVWARRTRIERLVLAHTVPGTNGKTLFAHRCELPAIRSCVLCGMGANSYVGAACKDPELISEIDNCVILGHASSANPIVIRNSLWLVANPGGLQKGSRLENVLTCSVLTLGSGCELRGCTADGRVQVEGTGNTIVDCILESVEADSAGTRIEHCNAYERKAPFGDFARPGKGCFSAPPMFVNPKNFDYRLMPNSPCRGTASDGGDIGVRYTPEMIEMFKLALELRARGIIKF